MTTNENFLLWRGLLPNNERLLTCFAATDRKFYAPEAFTAYLDCPQPIGFEATISAPHIHAVAAQLLEQNLYPGAQVLDVGCGSGYMCAVFARLTGLLGGAKTSSTSRVIGVDIEEGLIELARKNLTRDNVELAKAVELRRGDGWEGCLDLAPFDAIHVGAAASHIPKALVEQLRVGGRMVIPVGKEGAAQKYKLLVKNGEDDLSVKTVSHVSFVPLVRASQRA